MWGRRECVDLIHRQTREKWNQVLNCSRQFGRVVSPIFKMLNDRETSVEPGGVQWRCRGGSVSVSMVPGFSEGIAFKWPPPTPYPPPLPPNKMRTCLLRGSGQEKSWCQSMLGDLNETWPDHHYKSMVLDNVWRWSMSTGFINGKIPLPISNCLQSCFKEDCYGVWFGPNWESNYKEQNLFSCSTGAYLGSTELFVTEDVTTKARCH